MPNCTMCRLEGAVAGQLQRLLLGGGRAGVFVAQIAVVVVFDECLGIEIVDGCPDSIFPAARGTRARRKAWTHLSTAAVVGRVAT